MDINVELLDPNGDPLPVESVTVTEKINQGWIWSATLAQVPHTYTVDGVGGKSLLDAFLEDATYTLTLTAGGHTLTLPPLVVQDFEENVTGGGGALSGIDLVTYRLTRSSHNLPGLRKTTSAALLEWIAAEVSMAGKFLDYESWSFPILEVEASGRTALLPHIQRVCDVAGYEFRMVAANGGSLQFFPLEIVADPGETQPDWVSVVRRRAFAERITSLDIVKTSRMTDAGTCAAAPAGAVYEHDVDPWHSAQSSNPDVTFWNGHPGSGGTQLGSGGVYVGNGTDLCTHTRLERASTRFDVRGIKNSNRMEGVDLAFCVPHSSGILPARPADEPWTEEWLPSADYVTFERLQTYLWRANRDTHRMTWEGPPCLWLGLGYVLSWPGQPDSRVESVTHTIGGGQASTSADTAALGAAQW